MNHKTQTMSFRQMKFLVLFPLLLLLPLSVQLGFTQGCVEKERLALLDFKTSFASSPNNHGKLLSWNSSENAMDCCRWEGIICDDTTGHVVSVSLYGQGLESDRLRPSLLELQHLTSLWLSYNSLAMRIPEFFGSFCKLTSLHLVKAGFFGTVPHQLGNLSNLQILNIGGTQLSIDEFQWLSKLSSLTDLYIDSVNFSQARDWLFVIRGLPSLSTLGIYGCEVPTPHLPRLVSDHRRTTSSSSSLRRVYIFQSISSSSTMSMLINNIRNVSEFDLVFLNLEGPFLNIFDQVANLCNLKHFWVSACSIEQSLVDILRPLVGGCARESLSALDLSSNNLTGTIPLMLNKFPSLVELALDYNHLESFTPNNSHIFPATLSELTISSNTLLNDVLLSDFFANINQLSHLDLSNNPGLTISLNKTPVGLEWLDLSSCNLGPNLPTWLLALKNLSYLDISQSNISDSLPITFWENLPPSVSYLNLSSNNISGVLPNLPYQFADNAIIDLSSNAFYGPLPIFLFKATVLYLSKNYFSSFSPLPHSSHFPSHLPFSSIASLLDISDNNLSGELPHLMWLLMSGFNTINLANNNLSGEIPSSMSGHSQAPLYVLDLSNNRFSGPLPSFLRNKNNTQIKILDLSRNNLSGEIPSWLGDSLKALAVISLQSNNFTGTLPTSLCHLSSLQVLDLGFNKLSGVIPSCVYHLAAMAHNVSSSSDVFLLSEPNTIYQIPIEEAEFYRAFIKWKGMNRLFYKNLELVRLMDLSNNNLSGEIPGELMSLQMLDSLDLSNNNLDGSMPIQIGQLKSLEYLNLSFNKISGPIPPSLADISSLGVLDLSHNNLSGRIPKGTQLQGFNSSSFSKNSELCGLPLQVECPGDVHGLSQPLQPSTTYDNQMEDSTQFFYAGLGAGFACGFFGILSTFIWIRKWGCAFFHVSAEFGEWILLVVALTKSKISRKLMRKK